ncbi:hypothetical protein BDP55DRAFT_683716 [Colletotrichum godetiae]|uniref:Uncharacterized protein n=1 Tax=Colletotrichum godetiae TaxID=1209918 RepID=A0AAJ0A7P7_9PEZI|nr:uncharacterized protein BDP55DRAFT_683716 [Colletotrichum godetiae]KAK1658059.1 hypothetical protein BDP55DRAFT_683716 [Colletotrichum godetiae]
MLNEPTGLLRCASPEAYLKHWACCACRCRVGELPLRGLFVTYSSVVLPVNAMNCYNFSSCGG